MLGSGKTDRGERYALCAGPFPSHVGFVPSMHSRVLSSFSRIPLEKPNRHSLNFGEGMLTIATSNLTQDRLADRFSGYHYYYFPVLRNPREQNSRPQRGIA